MCWFDLHWGFLVSEKKVRGVDIALKRFGKKIFEAEKASENRTTLGFTVLQFCAYHIICSSIVSLLKKFASITK